MVSEQTEQYLKLALSALPHVLNAVWFVVQLIALSWLWNFVMPTMSLPRLTLWQFMAFYVVVRSLISDAIKIKRG